MSDGFTRRLTLGALAAAAASALGAGRSWAAPPSVALRPVPRPGTPDPASPGGGAEIVTRAGLSGDVGFALADLDSGKLLDSLVPTHAFPPASVTKAVTALYALDALGPGHRFRTRLMATGPVRNGTLAGDLVLRGGGDPVLETDDLAEMAAALKRAGVNAVEGRFIVDQGALPLHERIADGQPIEAGYNPAVSGLNLNLNRVHFEWRRQGGKYRTTLDAPSPRYRPEVAVARVALVDGSAPAYAYALERGVETWSVARRNLGPKGGRWLPVRRPAHYAADVFSTFARSHGIELPPPVVVARRRARGMVLVEHESPPLEDILRDMLKRSINLTAEVVGLAATMRRTGEARSLAASAAQMTGWAHRTLGVSGMHFVDHSGLGEDSRLTAGGMVVALVAAEDRFGLSRLMHEHPIRDEARRKLPLQPAEVRAKTGTLFFVSSLAGYVLVPDGRRMAFAILSADEAARRRIPPSGGRPRGARSWAVRARKLQQRLLRHWVAEARA